jgi:hypothetical protein
MSNCCLKHAAEYADKLIDTEDFEAKVNLLCRMFLCSKCGNKRCPKATDCLLECTNSNEPNQTGSRY